MLLLTKALWPPNKSSLELLGFYELCLTHELNTHSRILLLCRWPQAQNSRFAFTTHRVLISLRIRPSLAYHAVRARDAAQDACHESE